MRSFISNADEGLKIDGFTGMIWEKKSEPIKENYLQKKLFELESVLNCIKKNGGYFISGNEETTVLGFMSDIGRNEHPLISFAYASVWYNSNLGGIYLIGIDNIKNEYFAPVK